MIKKIFPALIAVVFGFGLQSSAQAQTCTTVDAITTSTLSLTNQSKVCETTASLVFTYNKNNGTRQFEYGKTTSYGTNGPNLTGGTKTANLTGLEPGTKYYFKIDGFYQNRSRYVMTGSFTTNGGAATTAPAFAQASIAVACTTSKVKTFTAAATGTAPITYSLSGQPSWITISGTTITFAPVSGSTNATVTLKATNSAGSANQTLNVTVFTPSTETAPAFANASVAVTCTTGTVSSYTPAATGTAPITYTLSGQPSWITLSGGKITFTPVSGSTNATVTLKATNSAGSANQTLNVTVFTPSTETAPKFANATAAVACTTSKTITYTASATGTAPITYSISGQPSWITLGNNGVITLKTPNTVQTVPAITITAKNSAGTATQTLNVTIVEAPVIAKNDVVVSFSTTKWAATDTFCLVAWIEDNLGAFVKTIAVWGKNAEDLADIEPWFTVAKSPTDTLGNTVDAVTSPTLIGNKNLSVSWNGTDAKKAAVPNGTYKFCVSGGIDGGPFPVSRTPFSINGSKKTVTGIATSEFKNIVVNINGGTTRIISHAQKSTGANDFLLNIGNTPIYVPSGGKSVSVCIYSLNGSLVMKKIIPLENSSINVPMNDFITGTYICKVATSSGVVSQKIMAQK
jgi:hypothetical protein